MFTKTIALATVGVVLLAGRAEATPAAEPAGDNDDSIRRIIATVSRRQIVPLRDGDYAPVDSVEAAAAARPPDGIIWTSYQWGVVLYGLLRSAAVTGDRATEEFVLEHNRIVARNYTWLAALEKKVGGTPSWAEFVRNNPRVKIGRLLHIGELDSCGAMGAQMLEGMLRHRDQITPEQHAVVARVADWIVNRQERLPDGTFWRPNLPNGNNVWRRDAVWSDDLYMSVPFLARWARYTGESRHFDDAARQIIQMAARVQDADGLWFHAWLEVDKKPSPYKWGRANGWAMVATVELLSAMPADHPDRAKLLDILRRHIAGVIRVQPSAGVWRQVLDQPELWEETSCTAMFAYSIARAVNRGWIDAANLKTAERAFAGLTRYVTREGVVQGTSQSTNIGLTLDYYASRKRPDDDLHARGVVLLAAAELLAARGGSMSSANPRASQ